MFVKVLEEYATSILTVEDLLPWNMVLVGSSEPLVNIYKTKRHKIPGDHVFQSHCYENPNLTKSNFILRKIYDV
jgi:hypothetical protein